MRRVLDEIAQVINPREHGEEACPQGLAALTMSAAWVVSMPTLCNYDGFVVKG